MSKKKTLYAFLIAPITTPVFFTFATLALHSVSVVKDTRTFVLVSLLSSLYVLPFAYAAELILGLPAFLMFRRYRISSRILFAFGGLVIGGVVGTILFSITQPEYPLTWLHSGVPADAVAGSLSAIVFREISS